MMKLGTKIQVNHGLIEILINIDGDYGLFKSSKYTVCRNLNHVVAKEILNGDTVKFCECCPKCGASTTLFNDIVVGGCDSCTFTAI